MIIQNGVNDLYSQGAKRTRPSAIRELCVLVARPEVRSLAGGWPDPCLFPRERIFQAMEDLMNDRASALLQYGSTEGLPDLRREFARRAVQEGGRNCDPDRILITSGSSQGLDLAVRAFIDPGDIVFCGLPTYFGATGSISALGGKLIGVPVDDHGMNTEILEWKLDGLKRCDICMKAVYVIPTFQNPTGRTMSVERRRHLVSLAEKYNLIIFEDDPYAELRMERDPVPSLWSLDGTGRVIHIRSLSKTFSPGMRLAWLVAEKSVTRKLTVIKQGIDVCSNMPAQYLALEFMRRKWLDEHIVSLVDHYRRKRDFLLDLLDHHFPEGVKWNRPEGGFFIWVELPVVIDAQELLSEASENNVVFVAGRSFFIDESGDHTLRLSYSQASEPEIEEAVTVLGRLIRKRLS
jgi:2-aminoadipate transaminase